MKSTPSAFTRSKRDYYDIFDVPRDASAEQIKAAYRFQLKAFHPDKFSAGSLHARRAEERIHEIVEAHRTLSNADSRAEYDRFLNHTSPEEADDPKPAVPTIGARRNIARVGYRSAVDITKRRIGAVGNKMGGADWWRVFLWIPLGVAILVLVGIWFLPPKVSSPPRSSRKLETALIQDQPAPKNDITRPQESAATTDRSPSPIITDTLVKFDLPTIARNARKAVVTILAFDTNGKPARSGSGFFISNDGRIVTNHHVINDSKSAVAKTEDGAIYRITGALADSASLDLAVLKAEAKEVRYLTIQTDTPEVGSRIAIIGSPESLEGSLTEGIVSAIRTDDNGTWIQITAPLSPGSSGSPVLNGDCRVIGVATLNSSGRTQNLNFARSSRDLSAVIKQISNEAKPRLLSDLGLEKEASPPPVSSPSPTAQVRYRVSGLPKKTPFLNIRAGPGANFAVVGVFTPKGRGIILGPGRVTNGTTVWQEVFSGSFHGWVNAEYLVPETADVGGGHNLDNESN